MVLVQKSFSFMTPEEVLCLHLDNKVCKRGGGLSFIHFDVCGIQLAAVT